MELNRFERLVGFVYFSPRLNNSLFLPVLCWMWLVKGNRSGMTGMILHFHRLMLVAATALAVFATTYLTAQCGVERWSVKTGTDPDVGMINLNGSANTTVAKMRSCTA